jgi:hypothetical protein
MEILILGIVLVGAMATVDVPEDRSSSQDSHDG